MSGGGQQQGHSFNTGSNFGAGQMQPSYQQQSYQPSFMSQPYYGYQNPYANIYSQLSQQQQMQPQAPIFNTSAPNLAQNATPTTFNQAANNQVAGLPATGQTTNAPVVPGAGAPLAAPSATNPNQATASNANTATAGNTYGLSPANYADAQRLGLSAEEMQQLAIQQNAYGRGSGGR